MQRLQAAMATVCYLQYPSQQVYTCTAMRVLADEALSIDARSAPHRRRLGARPCMDVGQPRPEHVPASEAHARGESSPCKQSSMLQQQRSSALTAARLCAGALLACLSCSCFLAVWTLIRSRPCSS